MAESQAWQHIYTNVEKEQSPSGRGGFQTLFCTRSALAEAEVEEMEARLLYFPSEGEPVKRVFFTLSGGKVVVGQIVPLADPDRIGRKGRYLAHSLVFAPEELRRLVVSPFYLFRSFPFVAGVAEALARGDFHSGDLPPVACEFQADFDGEIEAARVWPRKELLQLTLLALRAEPLGRQRLTIPFIGEPREVETALAAALFGVPASLRPRCTFDTYFFRCNPVATYYWAVGLPEPPLSPSAALVDVRARSVSETNPSRPENAYERWVWANIESGNLHLVARHRDEAFALCDWLEGQGEPPDFAAVPQEVIDSVFQVNSRLVRARLRQRLERDFSPQLVDRVFERIYSRASPTDLFRWLLAGIEPSAFLDLLYEIYEAQGFGPPGKQELQEVGSLLGQAGHRELWLVFLCWSRQPGRLRQELESLPAPDYREFLQTAFRSDLVDPLAVVLPGRGGEFLDVCLQSDEAAERNFVALVRALLASGESHLLTRLEPVVARLRPSELDSLKKTIASRPEAPQSFRDAIRDAAAALPRSGGLLGSVRGLLRLAPRSRSEDPRASETLDRESGDSS